MLDVITDIFSSKTDNCQSELCGYVFKIEYTEQKKRRCYLRLYSGTLCLRETILLSKKEKIKITEMSIPFDGEIVPTDTADSGEIVILSDNTLKLNDVLGDEKLLPRKAWTDNPLPLLRTTIEPAKAEQREVLLDALTEIADTDPLLRFVIDPVTHEIILSFLGKVQLEVVCSLLNEKYGIEAEVKSLRSFIWKDHEKRRIIQFILKCRQIPFGHRLVWQSLPFLLGAEQNMKARCHLAI